MNTTIFSKQMLWMGLFFAFLFQNSSYSQVNLSNGLIAYLPLDGNGLDMSGNNNNISNVSGSTQTYRGLDRFMNPSKSMRFAGERGKAEMSFGTPLLNNLTSYSVSFWVMMTGSPITNNVMNIFGQDNLLEFHYELGSPNKFIVYHPTGGSMPVNLTSPYYNTWRHIVITGNATEFNVYLNGLNVIHQIGDYTIGNNTYTTNIGGEVITHGGGSSNSWMVGNIDELRIYNRVINTDEITALDYNNLPSLAISNLNGTTFCAGSTISADYVASGDIQSNNVFYLQLSQPDGTFDYPIILDSIVSNSLSGTFSTNIPTGVVNGSNYKVRIVSSNLSAVSNEISSLTLKGVIGNIPSSSAYFYIGNVNGKDFYRNKATSGGGTAANTAVSNGGHLATVYDNSTNRLLWYNTKNDNLYIILPKN